MSVGEMIGTELGVLGVDGQAKRFNAKSIHTPAKLTSLVGVDHRFAAANSPRTNGSVENAMKKVLRMRVESRVLVEDISAVTDWGHFVPMVQWAVDSSYRTRLRCSPYKTWFRRQPTILLAPLVRHQHEVVDVIPLSPMTTREPWWEI